MWAGMGRKIKGGIWNAEALAGTGTVYSSELWVQAEYLVRILVAACLGLLIGSERKNRNKSAGIRTHVIVALGAALIMVVSK